MSQASRLKNHGHVQLLIKKENVSIVENAGIKKFKLLYMENTKMHEFKHPKYYKELRKRNKLAESRQPVVGGQQQSDQVISRGDSTEAGRRSPGPGLKPQASSSKPQATEIQATSYKDSSRKRQASSPKLQASSFKPQATSCSILDPS